MIHVTCIFVEYRTGAITIVVLKKSHDLNKTVNILKGTFHGYGIFNKFSKLFRMVRRFYGLWSSFNIVDIGTGAITGHSSEVITWP